MTATQPSEQQVTTIERRGGYRPGAGRPPGPGLKRLDAVSLRLRFQLWPIEHMLEVLNEPAIPHPELPKKVTEELMQVYAAKVSAYHKHREEKMEAARSAAPYLHPRLASVDITNNQQVRHKLDLEKLSTEELKQLEQITMKAQMTYVEDPDSEIEDAEYSETTIK